MSLETATYLDELDSANPSPTDALSQGDDHIRLIKEVLQNTFPNLSGAVTLNETEINGLLAGSSAGAVPTGTICLWYGSSVSVPSGWGICNGTTYPKADLSGNIVSPDLRDRVVIGAGTVAAQGATHGSATASATSGAGGDHSHATSGGAHSHNGVTIGGHALTISEMPAHGHSLNLYSVPNISHDSSAEGDRTVQASGSPTSGYVASAGGGAAHSHSISFPGSDGTHSHTVASAPTHTHSVSVATYQPALALHYILKL